MFGRPEEQTDCTVHTGINLVQTECSYVVTEEQTECTPELIGCRQSAHTWLRADKVQKVIEPAADRVVVHDLKQTKYRELRTKCKKSFHA